ncbi:MAG TPA: dNTP triphosphohydrolase, partial [Bryobacteraceae bacterium]|nr:dNTP triphosphohydrolase [Bryobacteraceae bacterium]
MDRAPLRQLRFSVAQSRGRRYPELPHTYRNDFQRDRDRIVHARAFRRLEDKTQVFTAGYSDHFRNRLTHTIEVAQISRTLASVLGLDEDLTEALALAHDIGHPPFAHAGEEELDRQMQAFSDRFDHNLHSLRIVETFEQRYACFPGLNLTFELREGMAKHSRDFEPGEIPALDEYLPGMRPPLEAQLIDPADEVAYSAADLDDGYAAGFFTFDNIVAEVPRFAALAEAVDTQFAGATERIRFSEVLRALLDHLVTGLLEGTLHAAADASVDSPADVRRAPRLARFTPDSYETAQSLKAFLRRRLYFSDVLVAERHVVRQRVAALFQHLVNHPDQLPEHYTDSPDPLHRIVCD